MKTKTIITMRYLSLYVGLVMMLIFTSLTYGQRVQKDNHPVPFSIRTSTKAPSPFTSNKIYNLRGDFKILGNSVLFDTGSPAGENNSSNSNMRYHKLSGDIGKSDIVNSSSADLVAPDLATLACTEIVYVGLYWSGRGKGSAMTLDNDMEKNKVKLKLPTSSSYVNITADNTSQIYYGQSTYDDIYVGYADITDKVRALGSAAFGTFSVANVATTSGNGGSVGYYGGWGLVVIYQNPTMPWRDITVFDGYSYVESGNNATSQINLSGFRAVQNGPVKIKMGLMAGEGDKGITGDTFKIRKLTANDWLTLSHPGNSTTNFFNSSIYTGGNPRTPNYANNYGTDIVMFDLDNTDNKIIANNQSSTTFEYSTTGDTYVIYNIVFAVDAYIPEVEVENKLHTSLSSSGQIDPGSEVELELLLRNKGSDQVKDGIIKVDIPGNMHYVQNSASVDQTKQVKGTVQWIPPVGAPVGATSTQVAGGTLVWTLNGNIPFGNPNLIYGAMRYKLKATENCLVLSSMASNCGKQANINGSITGTGVNSKTAINGELVSGYLTGACSSAVFDDLQLLINPAQDFLDSCMLDFNAAIIKKTHLCASTGQSIERADIASHFPVGTKFYTSNPTQDGFEQSLVTGDFEVNTTAKVYYAVVPGFANDCYITFDTILDIITTVPTVIPNSVFCEGETISFGHTVSTVGAQIGLQLYYFNENQQLISQSTFNKTPGVYKYYVSEGKEYNGTLCYSKLIAFEYEVTPLPVIVLDLSDVVSCQNNDLSVQLEIQGTDQINWQYKLNQSSSDWQHLSSTAIAGQQTQITASTVEFKHLSSSLNGVVLRAEVISLSGCKVYSNEMLITVENCSSMSNPALPSKASEN